MNTNEIGKDLLAAQAAMDMDDEVFRFILYECADTGYLEGVDEEGYKAVKGAFDGLGRRKGAKITPELKRNLRRLAMRSLGDEAAQSGKTMAYARELGGSLFGVDALEWLKLDELGEILWNMRRESARPEENKKASTGFDGQVEAGEAD